MDSVDSLNSSEDRVSEHHTPHQVLGAPPIDVTSPETQASDYGISQTIPMEQVGSRRSICASEARKRRTGTNRSRLPTIPASSRQPHRHSRRIATRLEESVVQETQHNTTKCKTPPKKKSLKKKNQDWQEAEVTQDQEEQNSHHQLSAQVWTVYDMARNR